MSERRQIISPSSFNSLPKPEEACEHCAFSLPCLFGHDAIQIGMFKRFEGTTAWGYDDMFNTTTTYGEIMDVRARTVDGIGHNSQDAQNSVWVPVPFSCPRFNTRAKIWDPYSAGAG